MNGLRVLALLGLCTATPALAGEESGFLFGFGAASLDYDLKVPPEFAGVLTDDKTTAWKGFVGWQFNRNLALEVAYIDAGSAQISAVEGVSARLTGDVVQGSLIGTYWLTDVFGLHARAGANMYDADIVVSNGASSVRIEDDGTEFGWGAGLSLIYDRALFRLEYEQIEFQEVDTTMVGLSIAWLF